MVHTASWLTKQGAQLKKQSNFEIILTIWVNHLSSFHRAPCFLVMQDIVTTESPSTERLELCKPLACLLACRFREGSYHCCQNGPWAILQNHSYPRLIQGSMFFTCLVVLHIWFQFCSMKLKVVHIKAITTDTKEQREEKKWNQVWLLWSAPPILKILTFLFSLVF